MRSELYAVLKELGWSVPADLDLEARLSTWRSWYEGEVPRFHRYRVYNGVSRQTCRRAGLGMAKKVCEDWASLLMNERVRIRAAGVREQAFLERVWEENRFFLEMNRLQERKAALGTAACVPRLSEGRLRIDCLDAEGILPLSWENGEVTDCAFAAGLREAGQELLYLQIHHRVRGLYEIENRFFRLHGGRAEALPPPAGVPETVRTGRATRGFVLDRMNIVNNLDPASPMGLSVFANALDQLRGVDVAYDSYLNEFILGKKRIMVKPEATKDLDGAPLFDPDELAFYILPEDSSNGSLIREIDMSLRTREHHEGIQDMLNLLAVKCGLGEQFYRFDRGRVFTATQVISENTALYRSVRRHELLLEAALKELSRILLRLGNDWCGGDFDEETALQVDFDDSILEDRGRDFERDLRLLERNVITKEEMRNKWLTNC